jgi:uncharacterized protein (TIGR02444 family)
MSEQPSQFWTFSLTVYREPAVQQECLLLQDRYGIDVNVLLFCAYVGAVHGAALPAQDLRDVSGAVAEWHDKIVRGLREVRRVLKPITSEPTPIAAPAGAMRETVKAMELEAERIEQMTLELFCAAHIAGWPQAEPAAAIADNIAALFSFAVGEAGPPELPAHLIAAALVAASQLRV